MSDRTKPTDVGPNRTGIKASPIDTRRLTRDAEARAEQVGPDGAGLAAMRLAYASEAAPVGTMPPPASLKGAAKDVIGRLEGRKLNVFLDKLGERLAFERGGVRLYEALMVKLSASHAKDPTITMDALSEIREDELRHAGLLARAIERLGGDPTTVTPCADVASVAASGWVQVLSDPRTTLTQCLDVMLGAELTDIASWELLIELAAQLGEEELDAEMRTALAEENRHGERVRDWLTAAVLGQADRAAEPEQPSAEK